MDKKEHITRSTNKFVIVIYVMMILYIIHFIILPNLFSYYFKDSVEAEALYWISVVLTTTICECMITTKLRHWIIGDIIYYSLILIYNANGAYDFDMITESRFIQSILVGFSITGGILLFCQLVLINIIKLLKMNKEKIK